MGDTDRLEEKLKQKVPMFRYVIRFQKPPGKLTGKCQPVLTLADFERTESIKVDGVRDHHHLISTEAGSIWSL